VIWALKRLKAYLCNSAFTIHTDHRNLCWLLRLSGRCRSRTRRRTVPRPSTRPTRTSEAALWTRRRRGGAAGGTPGRVGEAGRANTLVLKIRSCWLDGNAPLSKAAVKSTKSQRKVKSACTDRTRAGPRAVIAFNNLTPKLVG